MKKWDLSEQQNIVVLYISLVQFFYCAGGDSNVKSSHIVLYWDIENYFFTYCIFYIFILYMF